LLEKLFILYQKFNMFINGTLKAIICMQNVLREFELHNSYICYTARSFR